MKIFGVRNDEVRKAVSQLEDSHRSQVYNYLKATGYKLGLLYNFGHHNGLQIERKVK